MLLIKPIPFGYKLIYLYILSIYLGTTWIRTGTWVAGVDVCRRSMVSMGPAHLIRVTIEIHSVLAETVSK